METMDRSQPALRFVAGGTSARSRKRGTTQPKRFGRWGGRFEIALSGAPSDGGGSHVVQSKPETGLKCTTCGKTALSNHQAIRMIARAAKPSPTPWSNRM